MEEGFALKDALWHVLADKEHRMQHWILKLTIANARQDTSQGTEAGAAIGLHLRSRGDGHGHRVVKSSARCQPRNNNMLFQRRGQEGTGKGTEKERTINPSFASFDSFSGFPVPENLFQENICWKFQSNLCKGRQLLSQARMCRLRQGRYTIRFLRLASSQKSELPPHL